MKGRQPQNLSDRTFGSTDTKNANEDQRLHIAIAVCSRLRPEMLQSCLISLVNQKVPQQYQLSIILVENDSRRRSQRLVDDLNTKPSSFIHYFLETQPGIPYARNRAIEEALAMDIDYLAFIDDDEIAHHDWIDNLVKAALFYSADIVQGKVIYEYPDTDRWASLKINKSLINRYEGKFLKSASTNNIVLSAKLFQTRPNYPELRFDTKMQYTGGSDTDFFKYASKLGNKIVYTENAIVRETVPIERCTLSWLFEREARVKASSVYIDKKNTRQINSCYKNVKKSFLDLLHSPGYLLCSILWLPLNNIKSRTYFLRFYLKLAAVYGRVVGLSGRMLQPYKKVVGN